MFFFSSRRRHTRYWRDWSSDVCSSDIAQASVAGIVLLATGPREVLLALFAFPMMLASVVWPTRAVVAGALLSSVALVTVALVAEGDRVADLPPILTHPIALLISTALV